MYLAQGHNTATWVRIEPPTSRSENRRTTTRPPRLPKIKSVSPNYCQMNCGLFYAVAVSDFQLLSHHLFLQFQKESNQISDAFSLILKAIINDWLVGETFESLP